MPTYDYKCDECSAIHREHCSPDADIKARLDQNTTPCTCGGTYHRVFGFGMVPVMQEHYNHTVGKTISSMREMKDELKRNADAQMARDGIPRSYAPVDHRDLMAAAMEEFGDDGLQSQHDGQVARGEKPPVGRIVF